uniref:Uncharacterized protein n=1 Tax=Anguilla anguilla TaxID=7936 RepID=A0A0E9V814_ANGAN
MSNRTADRQTVPCHTNTHGWVNSITLLLSLLLHIPDSNYFPARLMLRHCK